jgi:myo-inositol 2-dehydrogenase / D-chiro-inositol 1-dehydrogenase
MRMRVRIGVVGLGYIAAEHMRRLLTDPSAEIVALCDVDTGAAERTRQALLLSPAGADPAGVGSLARARLYGQPAPMFAREALDAVFVCVPPYAHGPAERAAVEAGVAMLVEKPLALDIGLAAEIRDRVAAAGLVNAAGYQTRYTGLIPFLTERLSGRRVGMVLTHRFTRLPPKPWYRRTALSGGQLVEQATHQVDLLRCVVGEIHSFCTATARRVVTRDPEEVPDCSSAVVLFEDGAVGSMNANFIAEDGSPDYLRGIHIFADGLTASILGHEYQQRTVEIAAAGARSEHVFAADAILEQDRAFVRAVRERRQDLVRADYAGGVLTLAATLAHRASGEQDRAVTVAEILDQAPPSGTGASGTRRGTGT